MKIIRATNVTKGFFNTTGLDTTPIEAISELIQADQSLIQFIDLEAIESNLLKCSMHPFVQAIHWAYSYHLPVVISPDMIWYLIASGAALHINKNSEELRYKFVNHSAKQELKVKNDKFVFNDEKNPWYLVINEFATLISNATNNQIADLFVSDFSTTNRQSKIVSQIVLMDSMKKYFDFKFQTACGIPEIRVTGTKSDWTSIRTKSKRLLALLPKLKIWSKTLDEILKNFIDLFANKIDVKFWNQIYKGNSGSGGPFITGWIIGLFPYLINELENMYIFDKNLTWRNSTSDDVFGYSTSSFPYHLNQVPFVWEYKDYEINMLFVGGLVGVKKSKDQTLTPVFGYGVATDLKLGQRTTVQIE